MGPLNLVPTPLLHAFPLAWGPTRVMSKGLINWKYGRAPRVGKGGAASRFQMPNFSNTCYSYLAHELIHLQTTRLGHESLQSSVLTTPAYISFGLGTDASDVFRFDKLEKWEGAASWKGGRRE